MAAHKNAGPMRARVIAAACSLMLLVAVGAHAQSPQSSRRTPPTEMLSVPPDLTAMLRQLADAQKWAGEQIWATKDAVDQLPDKFGEVKDKIDANQAEVDKLRDEVKGLYVEISSLRQQMDELKTDVGSVDANVSGFRAFSGFFIAAMLLLLVIVTAMVIRR
jgi:peptidoglycan hydrolase CwlO-like protein